MWKAASVSRNIVHLFVILEFIIWFYIEDLSERH